MDELDRLYARLASLEDAELRLLTGKMATQVSHGMAGTNSSVSRQPTKLADIQVAIRTCKFEIKVALGLQTGGAFHIT